MSTLALALILGLGVGGGLYLVGSQLLGGRRRTLAARIAPQLGAPQRPTRTWSTLLPLGPEAERELQARLRLAGRPEIASHYRSVTLLSVVGGIGCAVAVLTAVSTQREVSPLAALVVVAAVAVAVIWWRQHRLSAAIKHRRLVLAAQFPLLAELLALGVAAGDGVGPALARAAEGVNAPLRDDVQAALARVRAGVPLGLALADLANQAQIPALTKCVDAILVATERGTPLAAVLRDQAADARESARRDLMESAGKREIAMMAPVVFGVLPLSVLFAVFPGLALLTLNM